MVAAASAVKSPSRRRAPAATATDWQQLDRQLCFALYSASLAMTKLYKPLLDPLGLTYPQYLALLVLWERDRVSVGELGERLFLDSGTLTPLLKRLEAAGLVQRTRDPDDERRVVVSLSPAGRALQKRARDIPPKLAQAARCSLDEVAALTERLQRLRAQLQDSQAAQASH
ncbi:MAG: MarR family transcriptional regulator [Proteobacteria bacterium]|nr:MarR family transcriptional regulator [Pseudomonadota bacterium]